MAKKETTSSTRPCDSTGCPEFGEFRAPKNRHVPKDFYWFCLAHVREYNKSWDYYKDMSPEEIEHSRIDDLTWNRPTRKVNAASWARVRRTIEDQIHNFDDINANYKERASLPDDCKAALGVMELDFPITPEQLKTQYKKLVKKYHPDINKGDKTAEEKFKKINHAHSILRTYLRP